MTELYLHYTQAGHVTEVADADDEWDRDNTHTDYYFKNICTLSPPIGHYSDGLAVGFEPEKGKLYFFVVAIYHTGDSFGWDSNGGMEVMEVFEDYDRARDFEDFLRKEEGNNCNEVEHGGKSYHIPWCGYFERLSYIEVVPATLVGS